MPLLTYQDVRPWARAIRQQVLSRQMPPWRLDRRVGIQRYKNDRSLSDAEIRTFVRWVDAGAPFGQAADLPAPVHWTDEAWTNGKPDVVVTLPPQPVRAGDRDSWTDVIVETGLTEDRYIRSVEIRPSVSGRKVEHHAMAFLQQEGSSQTDSYLAEYALGKSGDLLPPDTGRLIKAGAKLRVNLHYHAASQDITDRTSVAFVFYPKGHVPRHEVSSITVGLFLLDNDLDIPANSVATHQAFYRLPRAARIISFQPHMHLRGKAMTLEAIAPSGEIRVLGAVDDFDINSQLAYAFADEAAPVVPAGTVLRATATYDNTAANRRNPDPTQWVGFGNRIIDEMFQCHVLVAYLDPVSLRPEQ
jgi:hypothetical protein